MRQCSRPCELSGALVVESRTTEFVRCAGLSCSAVGAMTTDGAEPTVYVCKVEGSFAQVHATLEDTSRTRKGLAS